MSRPVRPAPIGKKWCCRCESAKAIDDFHRNRANKDGRESHCIACKKIYDTERRSRPEVKARSHANLADRAKNNPKITAVRASTRYQVRKGVILKQPCFVCGDQAEAHHPDYDQPLSIVWLCRKHHQAVHRMTKEIQHESSPNS